MRHNLNAKGYAYSLRPIADDDVGLIIELRASDRANGVLHPIEATIEAQRQHLRRYFNRPDDYYFVIERHETPRAEGLIGLYDFDRAENLAEFGRWILRPFSLGAVESALLIYQIAFEKLGLSQVRTVTVSGNARVLAFHDDCGLRRHRTLPGHFNLQLAPVDAIEHRIAANQWPTVKDRLWPVARKLSERLDRRS